MEECLQSPRRSRLCQMQATGFLQVEVKLKNWEGGGGVRGTLCGQESFFPLVFSVYTCVQEHL